MKETEKTTSMDRRKFLKASGFAAGAAGAAAVVAATGTAEASDAPVGNSSEKPLGYRETDHVRKFYELARF